MVCKEKSFTARQKAKRDLKHIVLSAEKKKKIADLCKNKLPFLTLYNDIK